VTAAVTEASKAPSATPSVKPGAPVVMTASGKPFVVNKWAIAVAVALGALLEIVDTSIVNVALADMQAELGATLSAIGWVVTSYSVANVIVLPMAAWLGDRFGKKRYFVFSLVAFTAASVLCGIATNLPLLIFARVLQGLFGGGLLAKAQSILFETFPKEEQAIAQGLFGAVVIAGPAIGPTLGGYLVTNINWRWIFFVNLPIGILATIAALTFLVPDDPSHRTTGKVDYLSIVYLACGLGGLQTVLEEGQTEDWWSSTFIWSFAVLSVVGIVLFLQRTLTSDHPIVDLRVLKYRSLWAGCIMSMIVGMGLYGANFAVPVFAQSVMGFTSEDTGFLLLPSALASAVGMVSFSMVGRNVDARAKIVCGSIIIILTLHHLNVMTVQTGAEDFFWPLIFRSLGTVMMFLPLSLAALGAVPKKDISNASGLYNLTRQLGGSIGIAGLTTLIDTRTQFHRTAIVAKIAANDPGTLERVQAYAHGFLARGFDPILSQKMGLGVLDRVVSVQASVMSFNDTFTVTAWGFMLAIPLAFLLGKGDAKPGVTAGGH
jgi:DHA2 family multidrug resistance protein